MMTMYGVYNFHVDRMDKAFVFAGTLEECEAFISQFSEETQADLEIYDDSPWWDGWECWEDL